MTITYGDVGVNRSIGALWYGDGGTTRQIVEVYYGDGGVNRLVYASSFTASAPDINATNTSPSPAAGSSTATTSGGIGPFTHSWAFISGGAGINLSGASTATVVGTTATGSPGVRTGVLRDTITDTGTAVVVLVDISVTLEVT